jgi:hypothetical protein
MVNTHCALFIEIGIESQVQTLLGHVSGIAPDFNAESYKWNPPRKLAKHVSGLATTRPVGH